MQMNVRLEGTEPEVPSQKLASLNVLSFGRHKNRITKRELGAALLGSKTGTDKPHCSPRSHTSLCPCLFDAVLSCAGLFCNFYKAFITFTLLGGMLVEPLNSRTSESFGRADKAALLGEQAYRARCRENRTLVLLAGTKSEKNIFRGQS